MRKAVLSLVLILSAALLYGYDVVYKEKTGEEIVFHNYTVEQVESGTLYKLIKQYPDHEVQIEFLLDDSLSTLKWHYRDPKENIDFSAERRGNVITLTGMYENESVTKTYKINSRPWKQIFAFDLEPFVVSGGESTEFWAVGYEGPGKLKAAKFKAKKKGEEKIVFRGERVETVHVSISLTGIKSMLWTGHYWYRKDDGKFIRYRGKSGLSGPVTTTELYTEKE